MKKKKSISINHDVFEQIKILAQQEKISVSQYIENVLLEERGDCMVRVQFNNKKTMYNANFKMISKNVVQLTGKNIPENTSGFKVYQMEGGFLGDYSKYTEIEAQVKGGYQFKKP